MPGRLIFTDFFNLQPLFLYSFIPLFPYKRLLITKKEAALWGQPLFKMTIFFYCFI